MTKNINKNKITEDSANDTKEATTVATDNTNDKQEETAITETPDIEQVNQEAEITLNTKIEYEKTIKELQEQIAKIKAQEKQLMLATKLNTIKEQEIRNREHIKYANQTIIKNLVHALLNFQRALNFKTDNKEVQNFLVGFKFIYDELIKSLEKEGLKEISAKVGDQFNSHYHEAVEIISDDSNNIFKDVKNNTIIEVLYNGYELHNRVISTVKVKIFQKDNKLTEKEAEKQQEEKH